ncbi:hypothetical protein GCM10007916_12680 [Psychromonas marina]|uniref:2'-5' RNA ligase family protein n=1 Tax=Psychromonas marina TaxID=88364 RepID=A0ABQ6DYG4_9GAMM|nr:hypothetical protein [Psychromonas marina]GLS90201.1 hypothetical protein GCM10007916_12680 [Psychromonas marina]
MFPITTEVPADIDFVDWHGGIQLYGFWCIKIEDDAWVDRLNRVRSIFHPYLQTGYQRFHHVTIATVGLMDAERWQVVERQVKLLRRLNCEKFNVCWEGLSSYVHSPIVSVISPDNGLSKLRDSLHLISTGDDSSVFDAHITLGYYATALSLEKVPMGGEDVDLATLEHLKVDNIQFCTYQTNTIKGPISVKYIIDLATALS